MLTNLLTNRLALVSGENASLAIPGVFVMGVTGIEPVTSRV
jgi:hypothetical protein